MDDGSEVFRAEMYSLQVKEKRHFSGTVSQLLSETRIHL
jgi:hypothetical protein